MSSNICREVDADDNENTDSGSYPTIFDLHFTKSNTRRRLGRKNVATTSKPNVNPNTPSQFSSTANHEHRTHPINPGVTSSLLTNFSQNSNTIKSAFHQSVEKIEFNKHTYKGLEQCKKNLNIECGKTPDKNHLNMNDNILETKKKYPFLVSTNAQDKENVEPSEGFNKMITKKNILTINSVFNEFDDLKEKFKIPLGNNPSNEIGPPSLIERKVEGKNNVFQSNYFQNSVNQIQPNVYNSETKHTFKLPTVPPKPSSTSLTEKNDDNSDSSQDSSMFETAVMSNSRINFDDPLDLSNHSMQRNVKDNVLDLSANKSDMDCTKTYQEKQDCPDMSLLSIYNSNMNNNPSVNTTPAKDSSKTFCPVSSLGQPSFQQVSQTTSTPLLRNQSNEQPLVVTQSASVPYSSCAPPSTTHKTSIAHQQPTPVKVPSSYQNAQSQCTQINIGNDLTPVRQTKTTQSTSASFQNQNENTPVFKKPLCMNTYKQPQSNNINVPQYSQTNRKEVNQPPIDANKREPSQPNSILKRSVESSTQNDLIQVNGKCYKVLTTLGKGGSSSVYLVQENTDSEFKMMALKVVNLSTITDKCIADGYLNEVEFLHKLQGCPCVITMFDYEFDTRNKCLYVLMEKGDSDLSKYMKNINKMSTMTNAMIIIIIIKHWHEMLLAVKELHSNGIIHSDLKPANFLFVRGVLKIIDFGIASSIQGDMTSVHKETTTGTLNYMSPEAIRNSSGSQTTYRITYKSDIWSLGCILYTMVYGRTPYSHITNPWAKMQAIADYGNQIEFKPVPDNNVALPPPTLLKSMKMCLQKDPNLRPTTLELLSLLETRVSEF